MKNNIFSFIYIKYFIPEYIYLNINFNSWWYLDVNYKYNLLIIKGTFELLSIRNRIQILNVSYLVLYLWYIHTNIHFNFYFQSPFKQFSNVASSFCQGLWWLFYVLNMFRNSFQSFCSNDVFELPFSIVSFILFL